MHTKKKHKKKHKEQEGRRKGPSHIKQKKHLEILTSQHLKKTPKTKRQLSKFHRKGSSALSTA
jgi:hypothetical protein